MVIQTNRKVEDYTILEKNTMEHRVKRFYELHQNKWFHVMNLSLEIIKTADVAQKHMLRMYGAMFFF